MLSKNHLSPSLLLILTGLNNPSGCEKERDMEKDKMKNKQENSVCALCGYTADGRFVGDICPNCGLTYWKCSKCGFTLTAAVPPDDCPECGEKCNFKNITCYTPECGGPGNIDPRL
jgi:rubrerythrin